MSTCPSCNGRWWQLIHWEGWDHAVIGWYCPEACWNDPGGPHPMSSDDRYDLRIITYEGYDVIVVDAGPLPDERIVPPAGEDCAFAVQRWKRRVEVCVSPTGRSVQVHVDGQCIEAAALTREDRDGD